MSLYVNVKVVEELVLNLQPHKMMITLNENLIAIIVPKNSHNFKHFNFGFINAIEWDIDGKYGDSDLSIEVNKTTQLLFNEFITNNYEIKDKTI
jgi:hypothetical protein